jgi:RimJ/RimL family protein N-acetyltransferase
MQTRKLVSGVAGSDAGYNESSMDPIRFIPLTAQNVHDVTAWFDDEDVIRWLGDEDWPRTLLRLSIEAPGSESRGRRVAARHALMACEGSHAVGLIDLERFEGGDACIALVVNPDMRQRGYCSRIVQALLADELTAGVDCMEAFVDPGHIAGRRCLERSGFVLESSEPNDDGLMAYVLRPATSDAA